MAAIHLTVLSKGGYQQVVRRINPLSAIIRSKNVPGRKIYVNFDPSIHSQLSDGSVAGWSRVCSSLYANLGSNLDLFVRFTDHDQKGSEEIDLEAISEESELAVESTPTDRIYERVCMGGTFDRLHAGHKILLSTALLRTREKLTVGVTSPCLLGKKTLTELIEPLEARINSVNSFISTADGRVEANVVEIKDPFGPAIVDPTLQCIVGSAETERGCLAINEKRLAAGMTELDIHIIPLVQDTQRQGSHEEEKISSSSGRTRLLGHRLRSSRMEWDKSKGPYMIGLTGGSASGKSSVGKRLQAMGAGLIDCDKLGHAAYLPGARAHSQILQEFGQQVLAEDGTINRRALGGIVFSDRRKLERLNEIVWPEIMRMAEERADQLWKSGVNTVVLDAAVLLEAGWQEKCHEIWACLVPREEAIRRIVERDGKTAEEAGNRLNNQMDNQERCKVAQTIFCTLWDVDITQKQVSLAWTRLLKELDLVE